MDDAGGSRTLICVQCDGDLLRRGIERAATQVGLSITDQESDATFVVRGSSTPVEDAPSETVVTVTDNSILISAVRALDPISWTAVGRLANELLGRANL